MTRKRTPLEAAAGKLISAVQREWGIEIGEPQAVESENVMHNCHVLLQAAKTGSLTFALSGISVTEFLGSNWVTSHPNVLPYIRFLESLMSGEANA